MRRFPKKKTYGSYKTSSCPFCGKLATSKNEQDMDVCRLHTKTTLPEAKCVCGSWLELRSGKYGPYFNCINCGNVPYNKGLEIRELVKVDFVDEIKPKIEKKPIKKERKEITITSDDVEYFS